MPGRTIKFTTSGSNTDASLGQLLHMLGSEANYAVTVWADTGNSHTFTIGRQSPVVPLSSASAPVVFYSVRPEEVFINDGGNASILYVDFSGPMLAQAQHVMQVPPEVAAKGVI